MNAFSIEEHFWIWSFCKKYWDWKLSWNPCKCTIWMHLQNNREKGPAKISCCHIKHFFIINPPNRLWTVVGHIFFWYWTIFFLNWNIFCTLFITIILVVPSVKVTLSSQALGVSVPAQILYRPFSSLSLPDRPCPNWGTPTPWSSFLHN